MEVESKIKNIIRVWAKRHEHSIVVSESEIDELAEKLEQVVYETARKAHKHGWEGKELWTRYST